MMKRTDYLTLIEEIRNTEINSLDEFIRREIEPLRVENVNFIETLYKDVHYLIKDIDKDGEGDLAIKNGDIVTENGRIKLTGYQSRLHSLSVWLHMEIVKQFAEAGPLQLVEKLQSFEKNVLDKPDYTPEYKASLDRLKRSLKRERKQNLGEKESFWEKLWDVDNLELKPNVMGLGLNLNHFINRFRG